MNAKDLSNEDLIKKSIEETKSEFVEELARRLNCCKSATEIFYKYWDEDYIGMKIFEVDFSSMYPVPCGLIITASNKQEAYKLAREQITHTEITQDNVKEIKLTGESQVLFYESGDY